MSRIDEQIAQLPKLRSPRLHALWRKLYGSEPPIGAKREFIARLLAYALQERTYGGLSRSVAKQLLEFVPRADSKSGDPGTSPSTEVRPGASLIRTWRGKTHEVTVIDRGFAYRGDHYRSLTEIAKVITGTHWSGPRFFGLKRRQQDIAKEAP